MTATLTEKVPEHKSGWELWVADESLMRTHSPHQDHQNNTTTTSTPPYINYNSTYDSPNYINNNNNNNELNNNNNNLDNLDNLNNNNNNNNNNNLNNNSNDFISEGSLTGIGSRSNYKPTKTTQHSSPDSSPKPPLTTTAATATTTTTENTTQPPHLKPYSPPPTHTPAFLSPPKAENKLPRPSQPPGIPYAHAYELYGRHVTRIQPPSSNPRSQTGPYPNLVPSEKKIPQTPPAEVCLECMMRDRDMAGVDVVGPGVWDRESDADFQEAVLAEAALDEQDPDSAHQTTTHSNSTTDEPTWHSPSTNTQSIEPPRKRIGKGQLLTMPALKAWTQMNPPATAHRWRTLQLYLREQRHYLELERQAKISVELENERTEELIRTNADSFAPSNSLRASIDSPPSRTDYNFLRTAPSRAKVGHRASSATLLTKGMVVETLDVSKDEKEASNCRANDSRLRSSMSSRRVSISSLAARNRSSRSPRSGTMNINSLSISPELLNQSDNLPPNSATDQHMSSSRAPSPTRFSFVSRKSAGFGDSMRPFSNWARARRSGSNSVLSFAPSGSLVDMHVGLSHDRHQLGSLPSPHYPISKNRSMLNFHHSRGTPLESQYTHKPSLASLTSSPTAPRFVGIGVSDARSGNRQKEKKKLRYALKGLWSKLGISRQRSCSIDQIGTPTPLGIYQPRNRGHKKMGTEDGPLAPPPPLSTLPRDQQSHRRTRSTLSLPLSSVCRFGSFRPQSVSTPTAGVDSSVHSPASQNFQLPSPSSKMTFNGTGTTSHMSTQYMNSPHDPQYDSLAEELEIPNPKSSSSGSRLRTRVRSLGAMSLLNEVSTSEEINKKSLHQTPTIGSSRSHDGRESQAGGTTGNFTEIIPVICSELHGSQEEESGVGMSTTNGTDFGLQTSGKWTPSISTPEKPSSVMTLMSRSSKIFSKFPGMKNRRASSGGILPPPRPASIPLAPATSSVRVDNLRSSTSSTQFSNNPIPPLEPPPNQHELHPHNLNFDPPPLHRPDYLPIEKSRHGVSRSSDFLALRYVSLGREEKNYPALS